MTENDTVNTIIGIYFVESEKNVKGKVLRLADIIKGMQTFLSAKVYTGKVGVFFQSTSIHVINLRDYSTCGESYYYSIKLLNYKNYFY